MTGHTRGDRYLTAQRIMGIPFLAVLSSVALVLASFVSQFPSWGINPIRSARSMLLLLVLDCVLLIISTFIHLRRSTSRTRDFIFVIISTFALVCMVPGDRLWATFYRVAAVECAHGNQLACMRLLEVAPRRREAGVAIGEYSAGYLDAQCATGHRWACRDGGRPH